MKLTELEGYLADHRSKKATTTVRIKKGVRPYGGRRVKVAARYAYPSGREVVLVWPPNDAPGQREYSVDEVEDERAI